MNELRYLFNYYPCVSYSKRCTDPIPTTQLYRYMNIL